LFKTVSNLFPLLLVVFAAALVIGVLMYCVDSPEDHIWFQVGEVELP
jgi:hypothetical protein